MPLDVERTYYHLMKTYTTWENTHVKYLQYFQRYEKLFFGKVLRYQVGRDNSFVGEWGLKNLRAPSFLCTGISMTSTM